MEPATSVAKKEQTSQGVPTPPNHDPQLASQKGPAVTIGPPALRETFDITDQEGEPTVPEEVWSQVRRFCEELSVP